MEEEILGPLLPITTYDRVEDVIDCINARSRPPAVYYLGLDSADRQTVLARVVDGNVRVNAALLR